MRKTISVERLRDRIFREIEDYKGRIRLEEAENSISRNPDQIKVRQSQIDGYRIIILGMEKVDELIVSMSR